MTHRWCCCVPDAEAECCTCGLTSYTVSISGTQGFEPALPNGVGNFGCGDAHTLSSRMSVTDPSVIAVKTSGGCQGASHPSFNPTHRAKWQSYSAIGASQFMNASVNSPNDPACPYDCGTYSASTEPGTWIGFSLECVNEVHVQSGTSYWYWGLRTQWHSDATAGFTNAPVWVITLNAWTTPQTECHSPIGASWNFGTANAPTNSFFIGNRYGNLSVANFRAYSIRHLTNGVNTACTYGPVGSTPYNALAGTVSVT